MPGIYLRTLSHFDWLDSEKESFLTIPGSYWLCHKKNIYKFIFRYHRTVKNTREFLYGRELLKITRRIIKCHPTQGQQFSTQHLLVTYNCTSWTRQDKMFAILKFQQRTNAAAFSYAFVLTISFCSSSEPLSFDLKYPIVNETDTEKKASKTVICATDKSSSRKISICQSKKEDCISKFNDDMLNKASKLTVNSNLQDNNIQNSANFHDNLDAKTKTAPTETYHVNEHNTKLYDSMIYENKSYNATIYERDMEQHTINPTQEKSLRSTKKTNEVEIKTSNIGQDSKSIAIQKQENQKMQNIPTCKIFSSLKFSVTEIIKDSVELSVSNKFSFDKNLIEENSSCTVANKDSLDNNKMTNKTIVDSNNVPQYFIKKEIENVKHNAKLNTFSATDQHMQMNLETEIKNINKDSVTKMRESNAEFIQAENKKEHYDKMSVIKYERNDNQHIKTSVNAHDGQLQNNTHNKLYKARKQKGKEFEKKIISEDKVLRSSNITDLVMEGLMFTIRQDQDSVTVIEQKTKLEVDEVLENSEKVETKAGEKCLLNSSLLRLENLVTMIDASHDKDKHRKIDKRLDKSSVPSYDNPNAMSYLTPCESRWQCFSSNIKNGDGCSVSGSTIEKSNQLIKWQSDNENKKNKYNSEIEKISDISFQSPIFLFDKTNAGLQNKDLLSDTNHKKTDKYDTSTKRHDSLLSSSFCSSSNSNKMTNKDIFIISEQSDSNKLSQQDYPNRIIPTGLSQQEANFPKIISDKAITVEQIPLALQNVVHTYRNRRFSSITNSEEFQCKMQQHNIMTSTGNTISNTISSDNKSINSIHTANNSLFIKLAGSEEMKNKKSKSCVMINKNIQETITCAKNIKEKYNDIQCTPRRNSSSKHDSPRKLQDITDDFYYDLLHVHSKDNAIQQRCLRQRRRSLNNPNDTKNNIRIEMLKFIQDITKGAKVVVKRLNIERKKTINSIC